LGDFSTIGRFFDYWAIFRLLGDLSAINVCVHFNIDQNWVGLHFGRFFTNSSGHPGDDRSFLERTFIWMTIAKLLCENIY
jgi:hypothetical protein